MIRAARRRPVKDGPRIDGAWKLATATSAARARDLDRSRRAAGGCEVEWLRVWPGVLLVVAA